MEKSDEKVSVKVEKGSPEAQEMCNNYLHPYWTAIQTCYGPGVSLPSPYCNATAEPGHLPQFHLWASQQPLVPPFGMPYPMIYPQGIVYAHPAAPFVAASSCMELNHKSSENFDQSAKKKLKGQDGLEVPLSSNNAEAEAEAEVSINGASQSDGNEASSDGSNGHPGAHESQEESNLIAAPFTEAVKKSAPEEANAPALQVCGSMQDPVTVTGQPLTYGNLEMSASGAVTGLPSGVWLQDERQLKREKRKQANRESAMRSRLRKQAEYEELMRRYESLKMENVNLKSKESRLNEQLEKVRLENAALMKKLNSPQIGQLSQEKLGIHPSHSHRNKKQESDTSDDSRCDNRFQNSESDRNLYPQAATTP